MISSTKHNPKGDFGFPTAQPANEQDFKPSEEDGARLVRAFVSIRSPERRRAVLEYTVEQASIDNPLDVRESCVP